MLPFRLLLLLVCFTTTLAAQSTPCPCCTDQHRAFDFWIGEWEVVDTAGAVVGQNTIAKIEDGCLLTEYWRGASGTTGRSFNYFNRADSTWNQHWIDNSGNPLMLKGHAKPGKMVMRSEWQTGKSGNQYYNRITWTANQDGSVTQQWDVVGKDDQVLQIAFLGIYRRQE